MIAAARACTGALVAAGVLSVLAAVAVAGGGGPASAPGQMSQRTITEVLGAHTDHLMSVPGVLGVAEGQCEGRPCIKVYVKKRTAQVRRKIPSTLGGYPVSIEETDEFRALDR